jgi:hypothetical protein
VKYKILLGFKILLTTMPRQRANAAFAPIHGLRHACQTVSQAGHINREGVHGDTF